VKLFRELRLRNSNLVGEFAGREADVGYAPRDMMKGYVAIPYQYFTGQAPHLTISKPTTSLWKR
jgi:hypothetical protein